MGWQNSPPRPCYNGSMSDRTEYMRRYHKQWYKDVMVVRRKAWFKENGPCVDCGTWENLELDHEDPATKVDHAVWSWSQTRRLAELAKCKVRCHRCHARKSHRENLARDIWKGKRKTVMEEKARCSKCNQDLPVSMFHKDKYACNGRYSACKNCRRKLPSRGWKGNWKKKDVVCP